MLSSAVGASRKPPPVDVITTYCRPSRPRYVLGVACAAAPSLTTHSSLPVFASKARKRLSSVAPTNTSPPAVAIEPPLPGRPVFCLSGGSVSVTPSGTRQANSPVLTSIAVRFPHGGCWHIMFESGSLKRPPPGTLPYGPVPPPPPPPRPPLPRPAGACCCASSGSPRLAAGA